jgi:putative DNA primase/helicase
MTFSDLFPATYTQPAEAHTTPPPVRLKLNQTHQQPFDWCACVDACTDKHVEQIATWRGYSLEFVKELREKGRLGIYNGMVAFPVHNGGKVVGTHYRLKDGNWLYFPKGIRAAPIVFGDLIPGEPVHVSESTWDGLDYMDKSGERDGVIITRGAGNAKLGAALIPQGSTAFLWTQNDEPAAMWEREFVTNAKCAVKRVNIPAPHKDLNDWTRGGANANDLLDALIGAETLREAEQSWNDALKESVITAGALHDLKLISRKKLLGDWFAEGDCGFIFAPRGAGKTFFALAIARALSKPGNLGDWQAAEAVKVLYVDGEMPADLMRERIEGVDASKENFLFLSHEILFDRTGKVLNIINRDVQQTIIQRCVASGVKVLILDNLSTLASGMRENEADSWELVNPWLLDLRRRKIAVVIIHHAGRSGEMRGTSKREDNVFWIIALDDAKQNADDKRGARFISRFTKPSRNTQEEIPAYEWHIVSETSGEVSISHKRAESLQVFRKLIEDGVTDCSQLAEEMKVSKGTISKWAAKAIREGWLKKDGREYALVEAAEDGNEEP